MVRRVAGVVLPGEPGGVARVACVGGRANLWGRLRWAPGSAIEAHRGHNESGWMTIFPMRTETSLQLSFEHCQKGFERRRDFLEMRGEFLGTLVIPD